MHVFSKYHLIYYMTPKLEGIQDLLKNTVKAGSCQHGPEDRYFTLLRLKHVSRDKVFSLWMTEKKQTIWNVQGFTVRGKKNG